MLLTVFKRIVFVVALIIMQLSVIPNVGWPFNALDLVLVGLIFVGIISGFPHAMKYMLFVGPIIDLFTPLFFSALTIVLFVVLFMADKVFVKVFTNKSLYSILFLILLSTILFHFGENVMRFINEIVQLRVVDFALVVSRRDWSILLQELGVNLFAGTIIFYIFYYLSNSFKTIIIQR